jgi:hypothetical protein
MGALFIASWLVEPTWLAGFVRQVVHYPSYTALGSPIWIITHIYLPQLGAWGEWILSLAALGYLIVAWHRSLRAETERACAWGVSVCLIVTNLVALRTATTNYVVFLVPFTLIFRALQRRRHGTLWVVLIQLITLSGLWLLFLTTVVDKFEHPIVYLPLPLSFLVIFALFRPWERTSNERAPISSTYPPNGA